MKKFKEWFKSKGGHAPILEVSADRHPDFWFPRNPPPKLQELPDAEHDYGSPDDWNAGRDYHDGLVDGATGKPSARGRSMVYISGYQFGVTNPQVALKDAQEMNPKNLS